VHLHQDQADKLNSKRRSDQISLTTSRIATSVKVTLEEIRIEDNRAMQVDKRSSEEVTRTGISKVGAITGAVETTTVVKVRILH
jgi:hypothetical protein